MSPDDPIALTPDQERAHAAIRDLHPPAADPAFRARLKQDFVSGRIGERAALTLPAAPRLPWLQWAVAPVAVTALVAVVAILNQPPPWQLMGIDGAGEVIADGRPFTLAQPAELGRRLRPGVRLRVPDGASLTLASAGRMAIELLPGTDMTLPAPPGRWFGRSAAAEVTGGEIHVTTGPAFHGAQLMVETTDLRLEVTGTTFAVLCLPVGTCVCVYEGAVRVGAKAGEMVMVPAGRRREVFNDGRPPLDDAMLVHEHGPLERLASRRDELLR